MREIIQCLMDWVESIPSDEKPHQVLRALAKESLKKAHMEESKRQFTNKDIVAAAEVITNEPANKWVNWNKTVLPYWKTRKKEVIALAEKRNLDCYPELGAHIPKNAGRGHESLYWIKAEPIPESANNDDEQNSTVDPNKTQDQSRISFQYELAENGEVKTNWWVKWLFHDGHIRLRSWHIWLIFGWLITLGSGVVAISYLSWLGLTVPKPVTTRELTALIGIFAFPYGIWFFFIRSWLRLFEDRIVVAPELITAIGQKSAQLEWFRNGNLRMIRLVSYTAPCPICGATVHLDNGEPDFPRRLVGRCTDSPREHIFSFDRVTKKGTVLRSPIL